jgi:hypothetical protein
MCKYFSCIVIKDLRVLWDANNSSHEEVIKKAGLKDDKLQDRDFVRLEMVPNKQGFFTQAEKDWDYKVDEKGTLPEWYSKKEEEIKKKVWLECQKSFKPYKRQLKEVGKFLLEIPKIRWLDFHGKIDANWHMSFGINLAAARDAVGDAVGDAAGDAVGDAVGDAAWDAARDAVGDAVGDAARGAAWDAARDAVGDAVGDAAGDAARGAAWDAAIYARCLLVKDKIAKKHFEHAKARMAVWKAGYGLRCDVNGKLFVYGAKKQAKENE